MAECRGRTQSEGEISGRFYMGTVPGKCPHIHAGLQVSECSGYNLASQSHTHK